MITTARGRCAPCAVRDVARWVGQLTARLPTADRPAARLPARPTARLPGCPAARLPDCPTARLPDCPTARLPGCPIARHSLIHAVC